ncbi:hypothetical protein KRP22_007633 [Phytophthora ramorum]|nr:hypothetical protein KRP22_4355 [Phytophthora ramorum]
MGKPKNRSSIVEQEFFKLELLLTQTANDAERCLKVLKKNLGAYDKRHGLHFLSTSKHFMRNDIRVAQDMITDLRHVAKRIRKSKTPSKSEIVAAHSSMVSTADAMNDLKNAGRIYDQNYDRSDGVADIINNVLGGDNDKNRSNEGMFRDENTKRSSIPKTGDTVEAVVRSTLRDSFCSFSALKSQVSATENALSPSIATRAKEAVAGVANKLVGDSTTSPTTQDDSM